MADINVERKGPSIWPWIIGLLVLALLIWAIAEMVDTDREEVAEVEVVEEPAAVPAPVPVTPEAEATDLKTLAPLGPEDAGRAVRLDATVVGTPTDRGFWVATKLNEKSDVLFVQTPIQTTEGELLEATAVQTGRDVKLIGVLAQMPAGQAPALMQQADLARQPDYQNWVVHEDLMLSRLQPGMQPSVPPGPQPGMQPPAGPGDTVRGRY